MAATAGKVVAHGGRPVTTYFFSTSGGHTENVENSFVGALPRPWLRGVDDPFDDDSPKHRWGPYTLSMKQADAKLGSLVKGSFKGIKVLKRGVSPRIVRAQILGSDGATAITGPQLRTKFKLFDSWITFRLIGATAVNPSDEDPADERPGHRRRRARGPRRAAAAAPGAEGPRRAGAHGRLAARRAARPPREVVDRRAGRRSTAAGATASPCRAPGRTACATGATRAPPCACVSPRQPV